MRVRFGKCRLNGILLFTGKLIPFKQTIGIKGCIKTCRLYTDLANGSWIMKGIGGLS